MGSELRKFDVTLHSKSALLMHWDNIAWGDTLRRWRESPENKKRSIPGDDRSPAFTWLGSLYFDGKCISMPGENVMRCLMEGGAMVPVPGGKNGKTFKAQTQSGMMFEDEHLSFMVDGKQIPYAPFEALSKELDFEAHEEACKKSGFYLYTKRARIGMSKHVRVRPRFDRWSAKGRLCVWDDQLTTAALKDILEMAGSFKGLGDWRPSSRTPGPFGRFSATIKEVKQ